MPESVAPEARCPAIFAPRSSLPGPLLPSIATNIHWISPVDPLRTGSGPWQHPGRWLMKAHRARPSPLQFFQAYFRHLAVDRRLRARRTSIRSTDPSVVEGAYRAMSVWEFDELNGPQEWFNAWVIPRALRFAPRGRPWRMVDLGCGSGGSSRILAQYAPPGSSLIGYDLCDSLLHRARQRRFVDAADQPLSVQFLRQSMLEPLAAPAGGLLPERSIDVAHAAGVVGHHLCAADVRRLAAELRRILAPDGIAILDAGPKLPPRELAALMAASRFELLARRRLLPFATRAALVFRTGPAGSSG